MVKWRDLEMRKLFNLFAAALVMLTAASCEKNEVLPDNNTEGKVITLKATINNGETKTSLGEKGTDGTYPVLWSAGDEIAVIQIGDITLNQVNTFRLSTGAETTSATFTCENAVDFDPSKDYLAVYPASAVDIFNGSFKGFNFSSTQTYKQNSFGDGVMPMLAYKGENSVLNFTNAFGILKLQLKGAVDEKVNSIEITSDKPLNGKALHTSVEITLVEDSDENKKVTLDCSANGGVALNQGTATDFHIALPAGDHKLSVCFVTNKGVYYKTTEQTIESGRIIKMASLNTETSSDFPNGNMSYVENGVYLGEGVALPAGEDKTIIWAPVNCGYDAVNFKYGKLYQWGRKYGQGYYYIKPNDEPFENNDLGGGPEFTDGPISWESYTAGNNSNVFFGVSSGETRDWLSPQNPDLWGNGTKTDHDPCPAGWRVPTSDEMKSLSSGFSTYNYPEASEKNTENSELERGYYFYGITDEASAVNKVFFPAAGDLLTSGVCGTWDEYDDNGDLIDIHSDREYNGFYWTSTTNGAYSHSLIFGKKYDSDEGWYYQLYIKENSLRASGCSVRCVKDMTQSQSMPGSN